MPRAAIADMARGEALEGDRFIRFRDLIRAMDAVYMKHRAEARSRAEEAAKRGVKGGAEARRAAKVKLLTPNRV